MSSPDDNDERSDDGPISDYAPKWARKIHPQGSPNTAMGAPRPSQRNLTLLRRSLDPETVELPQPIPRRPFRLMGFISLAEQSGTFTMEMPSQLPNFTHCYWHGCRVVEN